MPSFSRSCPSGSETRGSRRSRSGTRKARSKESSGIRVAIAVRLETRQRSRSSEVESSRQEAPATSFVVTEGVSVGGASAAELKLRHWWNHKAGHVSHSLEDLLDVVTGESPDGLFNLDLAGCRHRVSGTIGGFRNGSAVRPNRRLRDFHRCPCSYQGQQVVLPGRRQGADCREQRRTMPWRTSDAGLSITATEKSWTFLTRRRSRGPTRHEHEPTKLAHLGLGYNG